MHKLITNLLLFFVGAQARWVGSEPQKISRVYFANHTSHLDMIVLWSLLPDELKTDTWAAAATDYWSQGRLRRWICKTLPIVKIEREHITKENNPMKQLATMLDQGKSLIIFPEGSRSCDGTIREFKCGLYHLSRMCPNVDLIPVHIDNANRILPKGECLPIPLICSVTFGAPIRLEEHERKQDFLVRARQAVERCGATCI